MVAARLLGFRVWIQLVAGMSVFCVVSCGCRPDHSSRGVLPSVLYLRVIVKLDDEEALAH